MNANKFSVALAKALEETGEFAGPVDGLDRYIIDGTFDLYAVVKRACEIVESERTKEARERLLDSIGDDAAGFAGAPDYGRYRTR